MHTLCKKIITIDSTYKNTGLIKPETLSNTNEFNMQVVLSSTLFSNKIDQIFIIRISHVFFCSKYIKIILE